MVKATKLFLSSVILLLYTGLFIQGASEYVDVMEHIPVRSMKTLDPRVSLANTGNFVDHVIVARGILAKAAMLQNVVIRLHVTERDQQGVV